MNTPDASQKETLAFAYQISLPDGTKKSFVARVNPKTLEINSSPPPALPEWAELTFHQCPNCPLDKNQNKYCPVAANSIELIEFLKDLTSHDEVDVRVDIPERTYFAHTSLQKVAGSLLGIYMVTSGCPILDRMRPMIKTHLPFQNWEEALYRFITMYLFAQYVRARNGKEPDWEMKKFSDFYEQVELVNHGFSKRLNNVPARKGDAGINALLTLDARGNIAKMTIEDDDLAFWNNLFLTYWGKG